MKNNMLKFLKSYSGFTLIEMVVVIGVLGILALAVLAIVDPVAQFQKANDARRKTDLNQLQKALETFYQDNGVYPTNSVDYKIRWNGTTFNWGSSWQPYMDLLPQDPSTSKSYVYYAAVGGQAYYLYASLDRGMYDLQACNAGNACLGLSQNSISPTSCGKVCNYGVSSANVSP
jgi:general secretion pathway protein G